MKPHKVPSTVVGRKRLLKLADLLEKNAANKKGAKFAMEIWGRTDQEYATVEEMPKRIEINCHTTACAMGLAALSGVFKKQGLDYKLKAEPYSYWNEDAADYATYYKHDFEFTLGGKPMDGHKAAVRFFQITHDEAHELFVPFHSAYAHASGASGERKVAKRIRDFVAGKDVGVKYC